MFLHVIMFVYILIILTITVIPLPSFIGYKNSLFLKSINFIPFRDVVYGYAYAKREALLNIVMMLPFGFLYPLIKQNKSFIVTISATLLFSLSIETIQLFTVWFDSVYQRVPDITDVITNTFGGAVGYFLFQLFEVNANYTE